MEMQTYSFMDGKLHVYKRDNSRYWQCSTYLNGRNHRVSTKEETLQLAKEFARDWFMAVYVDHKRSRQYERVSSLVGKYGHETNADRIATSSPPKPKKTHGPSFKEAAEKFMAEYSIITQGQRSKDTARYHVMRINVHLLPYFGDKALSDINAGIFQEYRMHRMTVGHKGNPPKQLYVVSTVDFLPAHEMPHKTVYIRPVKTMHDASLYQTFYKAEKDQAPVESIHSDEPS